MPPASLSSDSVVAAAAAAADAASIAARDQPGSQGCSSRFPQPWRIGPASRPTMRCEPEPDAIIIRTDNLGQLDPHDKGPWPRWNCVPLGMWFDVHGRSGICDDVDLDTCRRMREVAAGHGDDAAAIRDITGGHDLRVTGWTQGRLLALSLRGVAFSEPRHDLRWLDRRPWLRRSPDVALELSHAAGSLVVFWMPPLVLPSRREILQVPAVGRRLALYDHPRGRNFLSGKRRKQLARDRWAVERNLYPPCRWCGLPSTTACSGTIEFFCPRALCTQCLRVFGRCPDCILWQGTLPCGPLPPDGNIARRMRRLRLCGDIQQVAAGEAWEQIDALV